MQDILFAEILGALRKDGVEINYSTFRNRIARLKKKDISESRQSDSDSAEAAIEPVPIHSYIPARPYEHSALKKLSLITTLFRRVSRILCRIV